MTTPIIVSVSGVQANDNLLTLVTTNALNEDKTNWRNQFTASGGTMYSHGNTTPITDGWETTSNSGYQTAFVPLSPTRTLWGRWSGASDIDSKLGSAWIDWTLPSLSTGSIFTRFLLYSDTTTLGDGSWPSQEHKLVAAVGSANPTNLNFNYNGAGTPPLGLKQVSTNVNGGSFVTGTNNSDGAWKDKRVYVIEQELICSSGGGNNKVWVNDQKVIDVATPGSNGPNGSYWEFSYNGWGTGAGYNQLLVYDAVTQSTSRIGSPCVAELVDNAVYASANKRRLYIDRYSETQIKAWYDDTGLSGGYRGIVITNNLGERSAVYDLSGQSPAGTLALFLR